MNWLAPSVTATLMSMLILCVVYWFLYMQEREPSLGVWAVSWTIYAFAAATTLVLALRGPNPILTATSQICFLWSGYFLLRGAHIFAGRGFSVWWMRLSWLSSLWIAAAVALEIGFPWLPLPTYTLLAWVNIWTGVTLLRTPGLRGIGRYLAGWSFILWGLHKANYPFLRPVEWFAPWGYLITSVLALLAAVAIFLAYFEKNKLELTHSEQRFRQLAENIREVFWVISPDWKEVAYISPTYEEVWGVSCASLYEAPESWLESVMEEDRPAVTAAIGRKVSGDWSDPAFPEYRVVRPDGSIRWVSARAFPVRNESGRVYRVAGIAEDITEWKSGEEALRRSEEKYRLIVENQNDLVVKFDLENRLLYASPTYLDLFGKAEEDLIGQPFIPLVHEEDREAVQQSLNSLFQPPFACLHEERVLSRHGVRWMAWSNRALLDQDGRPKEFVGVGRDITERKQVEESLRETSRRLQGIMDHSPAMIGVYDRSGRFLMVSRSARQVIGVAPEELIGKSIGELDVVENVQRAAQRFTWMHQHKQPLEVEDRLNIRGRELFLNTILFPLLDEGGEPYAFCSITNDVTERRRIEERLRESETRHRTLTENSPDIIMRFDRQMRHLYASPSVGQIVDFPPEDFIGRTHRDLGFPEDRCRFWEDRIRSVFESGAPLEEEFEFEGKRGTIIFNWRLFPEFDDHGQVQSVLSLSRDVTRIKRSEEEYRTLFREMLDGFAVHEIVCDGDGRPTDYRFLAVNPAFERMTGLRAERIVGRTVRDVLPGLEAHWIDTYGRVALTGEPIHFVNYARDLKSHFEVTAYRPAPGQFACIFVDVTERIRAEEEKDRLEAQLRQSQKMEAVGTLAGGIAHDFNNILAAILGYAELAELDLADHDPARPHLQQILRAAKRAKDLVQQILAFSRRAQQDKKALDLAPIVKETLKFLRASLPVTIDIRSSIPTGLGHVLADPTQIQQVVMNLCTNAAHAMRAAGGTLTVELTQVSNPADASRGGGDSLPSGPCVRLTIMDTGQGMDHQTMSRIFDPFFTTKQPGEGTGMGLAVVHGIVKSHDGAVRVTSRIGEGTAFAIYLPVTDQEFHAAPIDDRPIPSGDERILFVDDEEAIVDVARQMLEHLGYRVTALTDSREAAALFATDSEGFDLVISDQTMPKITGLELAGSIMRHRPDQPVILCTGYSDLIGDQAAKNAGIAAVLTKPLTLRDLARTVRSVLDEDSRR